MFRLWRRVHAHRPDILHAHESHALLPAAIVARLAGGCRVVAHRRVDLPIGSNPVSRWKYERGADRIVAISRRVRDVLRDDRVPDGKIRLVHSGIEVDRVHETPDPPLRRLAGGARDGPLRHGRGPEGLQGSPDADRGHRAPPPARSRGGDAAALAAAVEGVLGDATLARRLGAAARDRARDFSAARMVEGVERVYGEALGAERARRSTPRSISTTC